MSAPVCEWCGDPIMPHEASVIVDGDQMHADCAMDEEAEAMFSRDMGFQ